MFSELAKKITQELSHEEKISEGIYFTPQEHIDIIVNRTRKYIEDNKLSLKNILEPSCGACQFLLTLDSYISGTKMIGIEKNETIYKHIYKSIRLKKNKKEIKNLDFVNEYNSKNVFDLIIGNPPYFVMDKFKVPPRFNKFYEGRPNIFIIFILKSLELLRENGILAFVLPKNFLNCLYYNKTRTYIYNNYQIIDVILFESNTGASYIDTTQDTCCIIIQKNSTFKKEYNDNYCVKFRNDILSFNNKKKCKVLKHILKNSTVLKDLKFKAYIGDITWNNNKHLLTNNKKKPRLIYASDCKNNTLIKARIKKSKFKQKKSFINKISYNTTPIIVINRGYGTGKYEFNYCLVREDKYFVENHLICLEYIHNGDTSEISRDMYTKMYEKIINSFTNKKTIDFIKIYFSNNAMNSTELMYVLPIFI